MKISQKREGRTLHTHQGKNLPNGISVLNIYDPCTKAPTFVKETVLKLES